MGVLRPINMVVDYELINVSTMPLYTALHDSPVAHVVILI